MGRVKTFANNGDVYPDDLNNIQDDYEKAFAAWRTLYRGSSTRTSADGANLQILDIATGRGSIGGTPTIDQYAFYLDPAELAQAPRSARVRIVLDVAVNAVAPLTVLNTSLLRATSFAGASGSAPTITAITALNLFATSALAANSQVRVASPDLALVTAGWHLLQVATPGAQAGGSVLGFHAELQCRQT